MTEQSQFGVQPEEQFNAQPEELEGEHFLRLLGLEELAGQEITLKDGRTLLARNFLDICGDYARPLLTGFEAMSLDDTRYEPTKEVLRGFIGQYVNKDLSNQEQSNNE